MYAFFKLSIRYPDSDMHFLTCKACFLRWVKHTLRVIYLRLRRLMLHAFVTEVVRWKVKPCALLDQTFLFPMPPLGVHTCHVQTSWEDKHCHLVVTKANTSEETPLLCFTMLHRFLLQNKCILISSYSSTLQLVSLPKAHSIDQNKLRFNFSQSEKTKHHKQQRRGVSQSKYSVCSLRITRTAELCWKRQKNKASVKKWQTLLQFNCITRFFIFFLPLIQQCVTSGCEPWLKWSAMAPSRGDKMTTWVGEERKHIYSAKNKKKTINLLTFYLFSLQTGAVKRFEAYGKETVPFMVRIHLYEKYLTRLKTWNQSFNSL